MSTEPTRFAPDAQLHAPGDAQTVTPGDAEPRPHGEPAGTSAGPVEVPAELRSEIERHMALYPDSRSAALPALRAAQKLHGWCSPQAIAQAAEVMGVTPAYLEAVASFYDMLEMKPIGTHSIYVCTNISCSLRGADRLYETVRDAAAGEPEEFNVRAFECLGACDIAPMASVDGVYVGPLTEDDVPQMLDDIRQGRPVLPDKQLATRLVADPHANSREFPAHPVQTPSPGGAQPAGGREAAPPSSTTDEEAARR